MAVVAIVTESIAVGFLLHRVFDGRAVVANIALAVTIGIGLIIVWDLGTVVAAQGNGGRRQTICIVEVDGSFGEPIAIEIDKSNLAITIAIAVGIIVVSIIADG